MASYVDICNMALSDIGTRSVIADFAEGSKEARACAVWYDQLRKSLLRGAPWGFARKTAPLSVQPTPTWPWSFQYTHPADCLKLRYLIQPPPEDWDPTATDTLIGQWWMPSRSNRFLISNSFDGEFQRKVVLSNLPDAWAVYTVDVENVELMDELFKQALAAWLASKIVIQLTGNVQMRSGFIQTAQAAVDSARAINGQEALPSVDHTPDWITVRGLPAPYEYGALMNAPGLWYSGYDSIVWGS